MTKSSSTKISSGKVPLGDVIVMEYGARLDKESIECVQQQIISSRLLYNDIIASIRQIITEMNEFIMSKAGKDVTEIKEKIESLTQQFDDAKANSDEYRMKEIAQERRILWRSLGEALKSIRKEFKTEIQSNYLTRIGRHSASTTYQLRCKAVENGLGWATANVVLESALLAFKKSFMLGRPPRFAKGSEKIQDSLTLQFTAAGGAPVSELLTGKHTELSIIPTQGCGKRKYGSFRFRLGPAKNQTNATGTWQYHRPIPEGAHIGLARLVRHRIGKDHKWSLQFMVKLPEPIKVPVNSRKPMVVVHMGWASDLLGRRVSGIADCADPGAAQILQLPPIIEQDLALSGDIQGRRDSSRDEIIPKLKAIALPEGIPDEIVELFTKIKPLQSQYISSNRIHYFCHLLKKHDAMPEWLEEWRKSDRLLWQAHTHIARRARNARKDFYRNVAINLARQYEVIVIEPLQLAEAATKVNNVTGEKTEFSKKARSGRVVASLYEFESAIRWAAAKTGSALLELNGDTASKCAICGSTSIQVNSENGQILHCDECGAVLDRKQNGAAIAWQLADKQKEGAVEDFWVDLRNQRLEQSESKSNRMSKIIQKRRENKTMQSEAIA
jgi:hypothetical protein